jgi:lipid-binding SYLF domain-containing protein
VVRPRQLKIFFLRKIKNYWLWNTYCSTLLRHERKGTPSIYIKKLLASPLGSTDMDAYFSTPSSSDTKEKESIHDSEHSARNKAQIATEWAAAKQRETARLVAEQKQQMQYENNQTLRGAGLDPTDVLENLTPAQSDVLLASEPDWVKDSLCNECKICNRYFNQWSRRKHHCRFCGGVVCHDCSQYKVLLPLRFTLRETARVCIPCHQRLEPVQPMLQRLKALKHRTNTKYNPDDKLRRQINFPIKHSLSGEVRKAAYSVRNLFNPATIQDQKIPASLLKDAKGILFITVVKVGFLASVRMGTGLVVAKLPNGEWSAPSAVYTGGFGFGAQAGSNVTDFVTVLMTNESVRQFAGDNIGTVGGSLGVSLGVGRGTAATANIQNGTTAASYTYSQSRGLYAGVALELGGIRTRHDVNQKFYGRNVTPLEILSGTELPPIAAAPLYNELRNAAIHWGGGGGSSQITNDIASVPAPLSPRLSGQHHDGVFEGTDDI